MRRRAQGPDEARWSPAAGIIDFTVMDRVDAVVNLSGASLARLPWTKRYRGEILDSRIAATRTLTDAMRKARRPPAVFLSASAVGYLRRPARASCSPSTRSAGTGFLADVVGRVGGAPRRSHRDETRTVCFRTGIVVGHGGAMKRIGTLTTLRRLGAARHRRPALAVDRARRRGRRHRAPAGLRAVGAREPRRARHRPRPIA